MAESFPFSIVANISTKIASLASQEPCSWWILQPDIRKLEQTLSNMKATLLHAEEKHTQNQGLLDWLAELSDLLYDADDLLDKLGRKVVKSKSSKRTVRNLFCSIKLSHKITLMNERLSKMAAAMSSFTLNDRDITEIYSREMVTTRSFVDPPPVFGRDVDKGQIISLLMEPNSGSVSVIPIVGNRGVGKTTLAKQVFSDRIIEEHFNLKLWVDVPEDFDIISLMKQTYTFATGQILAEKLTSDQLNDRLQETLADKRLLIVLDNVCNENEDKWEKYMIIMTSACADGSRILVITHSEQVEEITRTVETPCHLRDLSPEDCWSLFVKSAFKDGAEEGHSDLNEIGQDILTKIERTCGRLTPLAVRTLGSLLYENTDRSCWLSIRDDSMWERNQEEDNNIRSVLKFCYDHLPSHLQRCVAYCCLFPKEYRFNSDSLIQYWMGLGFLTAHDENEEMEDVGLQYLKELFSRCFFHDVENHGYYFTFKMHELIYDLAMKVAERDCKRVDLRTRCVDENVRHLSFHSIKQCYNQAENVSEKVRTIIIRNQQRRDVYFEGSIFKFKYLRLLFLNGLQFEKLPESVGALKHLRYLDLSANLKLVALPKSLSKLHMLQTLRLLGCSRLEKLFNYTPKMIRLRFLELTTKEERLLQNGIECLSPVRYLHLHDCHNLVRLPDRMQTLSNLRTLILQGCLRLESLPRSMISLNRLERLVICRCPMLNLTMELQGEEGLFLNLKVFMIFELQALVDLPQLILQGSALEYMKMEACPNLTGLPVWLTNLTSLQKLEIVNCLGLSYLPDGMQNLTSLKELKIQKSPILSQSCRQNRSNISHVEEIQLDPIEPLHQ